MRKAIFTGAAVLTTALGGATAFGGATAHAAGASLGCGVTVHVHNKTSSSITVQWDQSDSRAKITGIAGPWKRLGSGSLTIPAGGAGSKAFTLVFPCETDHQYRVHYTHGASSAFAYSPANRSNWTTNTNPNVNVK
jgi:hypothetical protein